MCCIVSSFLRVCQKIPLQYGVKVLASSFHFRDHTSGPICRGGGQVDCGSRTRLPTIWPGSYPGSTAVSGFSLLFFSRFCSASPLSAGTTNLQIPILPATQVYFLNGSSEFLSVLWVYKQFLHFVLSKHCQVLCNIV